MEDRGEYDVICGWPLSKYQEPRSGSGAVLVGNVGSPEPFPNSGNSAGMKNPFCEHCHVFKWRKFDFEG